MVGGVAAEIENEDDAHDEELLLFHVHDLKGHETHTLHQRLFNYGRIVSRRADEHHLAAVVVVTRKWKDAAVAQHLLDVRIERVPSAVEFRKRRAEAQRQVQFGFGFF